MDLGCWPGVGHSGAITVRYRQLAGVCGFGLMALMVGLWAVPEAGEQR